MGRIPFLGQKSLDPVSSAARALDVLIQRSGVRFLHRVIPLRRLHESMVHIGSETWFAGMSIHAALGS